MLLCLTVLTPEESTKVGSKIWKNECGATLEGLVHWNKGEEFGSFGIGHFIWYPKGQTGIYEETFPSLLQFLQEQRVEIPPLLLEEGCPWSSYEEFTKNKKSKEANQLRDFLYVTRGLQALFMQKRQEEILAQVEKELEGERKQTFQESLTWIKKDPRGAFVLIDYSNFKGSGLSPLEAYKGEGWGLLQVLLAMDLSIQDPIEAFVKSAKELLEKRVQNSPQERGEKRWLNGWNSRLDTYLKSP